MNAFPDTALAVVFVVVIGGALLYLGGRMLANWLFGKVSGGRK